jgi:hypothetical protein
LAVLPGTAERCSALVNRRLVEPNAPDAAPPLFSFSSSTTSASRPRDSSSEERHSWLMTIRDKVGQGVCVRRRFCDANVTLYLTLHVFLQQQKRPVTDPEYDSSTLFIPESAWSKFTPFEKQVRRVCNLMSRVQIVVWASSA